MGPKTFIIPDIHGKIGPLNGLLDLVEHEKGVRVVQLGDLMNAVFEDQTGDSHCLQLVENGVIDVYLVGNHEHPYLGGPPFGGYYESPELRSRFSRLYREGKVQVAYAQGNTLITHAGLAEVTEDEYTSASQAAEDLNALWYENPKADIFSAIGPTRGGWFQHGGVLWADWSEAKNSNFNQIVGHTPQRDGLPKQIRHEEGTWAWCIDCGVKWDQKNAVGMWLDDEGSPDGLLAFECSDEETT